MNSWQASVQDTNMTGGLLVINVTYTSSDGTNVFTEQMQTQYAQPDDWLQNQINNRLNQLNALSDYQNNISSGTIVASTFQVANGELSQIDTITSPIIQNSIQK